MILQYSVSQIHINYSRKGKVEWLQIVMTEDSELMATTCWKLKLGLSNSQPIGRRQSDA